VHLVEASGKGQLYCAKAGWHLRTIYLHNETLSISSNELIAFEKSLDFELELIGKGLSIATGGIVEVKISGAGWVAIGVHGDPLVLPVTQDRPLFTDPHATVAWTARCHSDVQLGFNPAFTACSRRKREMFRCEFEARA
jgi:uncharacterized protein (AIM24 family)